MLQICAGVHGVYRSHLRRLCSDALVIRAGQLKYPLLAPAVDAYSIATLAIESQDSARGAKMIGGGGGERSEE